MVRSINELMADENINDKEEQDDFFGDDDDFGLPDLDYEALDDDTSGDAPADEPKEEVEEPTPEPEPAKEEASQSDDFGDSVFDDAEDFSDIDLGDDEGLDVDDSSLDLGDDFGTEEKDDSSSSSESGDDFMSEDSLEDFDVSNIDLEEEIPDSVFDSDTFDEDEFKDFESDLAGIDDEFQSSDDGSDDGGVTPSFSKDEASASRGKFTRIVIFGTILFVGLGFGFWYAYNSFSSGEEPPKKTAQRKTPTKTPAKKPASQAKKPASNAASSQKPASTPPAQQTRPASRPATQTTRPASTPVASNPGTVNKLTERTGNTYVIVGSFVDEDIAADFANKLASEGKSPSIIPPFGNGLFHRVAIAGFPTIASAQQNLDSFKPDYGEDVWVLKY